mmetsp:Transcript_3700/g.13215  ORF Transcript_3700/g.13215 Transcript_3700/m.13215 type:complete len:97 (+) Transcript_3700:1865-2155(+)
MSKLMTESAEKKGIPGQGSDEEPMMIPPAATASDHREVEIIAKSGARSLLCVGAARLTMAMKRAEVRTWHEDQEEKVACPQHDEALRSFISQVRPS